MWEYQWICNIINKFNINSLKTQFIEHTRVILYFPNNATAASVSNFNLYRYYHNSVEIPFQGIRGDGELKNKNKTKQQQPKKKKQKNIQKINKQAKSDIHFGC